MNGKKQIDDEVDVMEETAEAEEVSDIRKSFRHSLYQPTEDILDDDYPPSEDTDTDSD